MHFLKRQKKRKRKIFPVLLALITSCSLFSQQKNDITIKQLTDSIQSIVTRDHVPGLMVGITSKDSVIFSGGFGYADIKAKRPSDGKTLFRMGSVTKMFVSLAILQLIKDGKLNLDDELKKVAPEVPFQNKWETSHPVRIVHLLEHTAGFDDMKLNRLCSQVRKEYSGKEAMLFQENSLICRWKPGERFAYSNPGYVILGYIIEKITGKSYGAYIAENILQPLGMTHSNFNLFSKLPETDTKQYVVHAGKIIEVPSVSLIMGPAGSLWSCADDMVKFLQLFLADGQPIFNKSTIHEMETVHSSMAAKAGLRSGYALANEAMFLYKKNIWRGHSGLLGTCFSMCAYNREAGFGFVMSSNGNQQNAEIEGLIIDYLEQYTTGEKLDTISTELTAIAPFLGQYLFESPRNEISGFKDKLLNTQQVYIEKNNLFVKSLMGDRIKLVRTTAFKFAREGANTATIIFTKSEEGKNVMVMDGAYYEQASFFTVKLAFWLVVIAVFFAVTAIFAGLISLIAFITGRLQRKELFVRILPMAGLLLLIWSVMQLLQVQDESYLLSELTNINTRTSIIFSGSLLFGLLALVHLFVMISKFSQFKNQFISFYWMLTALSVCYIAFILFQNGWIGLRTWAM